jgi:hypothetical protein
MLVRSAENPIRFGIVQAIHGRLLDPLALHAVPEAYVRSAGIAIGTKPRRLILDSGRKHLLSGSAVDLTFGV